MEQIIEKRKVEDDDPTHKESNDETDQPAIVEEVKEDSPIQPSGVGEENPSTVSEDMNDAFVDANLALMRELDALADALQSLPAGFKEKMDSHRENLAFKLENRLNSLKEGMNRAPFIKTRDKFSFVAGVTNVALTFLLLGRHPEWAPIYYTIKALLLLTIRWYIFKEKKYHYFLFDFCYYVNVLVLLYLHVFPRSETLFLICFAFCTGPLAWSVVTWRNSLVFHSLDKTTSLFIHLTPNILFYALRWLDQHPESVDKYETFRNKEVTFGQMVLLPIIPYLLWQALYFIKVQVISAKKVQERDYQTTFRWFSSMDKGRIGKLVKKASPNWRLAAFMGYQLLYTVVTMLPSVLYLRYFWAHTLLIAGMCIISAWNGANYYFEVFSTRYIESLERGTERIARLRRGSLALQAAIHTVDEDDNKKSQ
jgi:hypothetical protein